MLNNKGNHYLIKFLLFFNVFCNVSVDKFREWLRFVGDYEADDFKCSKDYYDEEMGLIESE